MHMENWKRASNRETWAGRAIDASANLPGPGGADEHGFTLVETIVAMVAALLVFGATVTLLNSGQRIQARDAEWALTMQQDRVGLARMVRDIRQATSVKEANAGSILFLATIGGKELEVKYECATVQSAEFKECVRLAAEKGKALPASGPIVAKDLLNGTSVFTYSPSSASPRAAIVKLELPARGTLKQAASVGFQHKVVLEDAAFMRNVYLEG
jgi:type II secretory pathway pseudopilin PulG